MTDHASPLWLSRGKTIRELIKELSSFEDQELEVRISADDGESFHCISLVEKESDDDKAFGGLVHVPS